jgi:hypothetical protein
VPSNDRGPLAKTPILLEWDGETLTAHWPEATRARARYVRSIRLGGKTYRIKEGADGQASLDEVEEGSDADWDRILERIDGLKRSHYALFAVRPSGFGSFLTMAQQFREREIEIGYEPIDQAKPVRLLRDTGRREVAR